MNYNYLCFSTTADFFSTLLKHLTDKNSDKLSEPYSARKKMDPVTLSTITSAVTLLARECGKGVASEAGKSIWNQIKSLFGWDSDPDPNEIAKTVAEQMVKKPHVAKQIVELLQSEEAVGESSMLVRKIDAKKVVVAQRINIEGDLNM